MELTVLGGAAACPNPGQGSSSYLVKFDERFWLLDCGPDTIQELRKHAELDQIERILISHVHADHTLDLVPLRYGIKYDPGLKPARPFLHLPPDGSAFLQRVAKAFAMGTEGYEGFFEESFQITEYTPESGIEADGIKVRFLQTNHPVPCWAMRLETSSGTLVYLADSGPLEELVTFAEGADILICEGTYPDDASTPDTTDRLHLSAWEAGAIARDAGAREFVLTHVWASMGIDRYLEAATAGFGRQVTLGRPGVKVSID
jgi:ribonuclease BN (tRNA processing enzyme)